MKWSTVGDRYTSISRENVQFIHDLGGAYPAIEPRKRFKAWSRGYRGYREVIVEYNRDPTEWKREHEYVREEDLVETVCGMMKMRFTGGLTEFQTEGQRKEQRRELLIKVVLHNSQRLIYLECAGR